MGRAAAGPRGAFPGTPEHAERQSSIARPGPSMGAVNRIGAALAATLMLLAPALWNRFPLLQYDTGGYLARWFEHTLEESRSTVYGLTLDLLARPDFWPVVLIQAGLTVWILALVLRVHGFGTGA